MDQQSMGYQGRRLASRVSTGVFECNRDCGCDRTRCVNRVVQQGVTLRLQLFKTAHGAGWGGRCLDEVPRGAFISTYTGVLLLESKADRHGLKYGDEYFAQLDLTRILFADRKKQLEDKLKEAISPVASNEVEINDQVLPDFSEPISAMSLNKSNSEAKYDMPITATYSSSSSLPSNGNK